MKNKLNYTVAALCISMLVPSGARADTDLEIYYAISARQAMHQCISDLFMSENPDIKVKSRPAAVSYTEAHETVLRQSLINDLPDIFFPSLQLYPELVARDIPVDLTGYIEKERPLVDQGYIEPLLDLTKIDGELYGFPVIVGTPVVLYNMDLVRKAGGDGDHLPTNWSETVDLAEKINNPAEKISGAAFPLRADDWLFQALVNSAGGSLLSDDRKDIAFDSAEGAQAMVALDSLVKRGGVLPIQSPAAYQQFAAGTVGILFTSQELIERMKANGVSFEMGSGKFPAVNPGKNQGMPIGGMGAVVLTKDQAKQEAAYKYAKFASGPLGQSCVVKYTGYPPVTTKANEIPEVARFFAENPLHQPDVDQVQVGKPWISFPGKNSVRVTKAITDGVEKIIQQKDTPENVLDETAQKVRALIKD